MNTIYDMLIIGGGPGGYTAALYAARAGMTVLVLEKLSAGGQMALTHQIDNYPGFPDGIDGFTLAMNMQQQAQRFGAQTLLTEVTKLDLQSNPKIAYTSDGCIYGKTIVIATGADPKPLGLPGEQKWMGSGIHYCAACDGNFYRDKTVAVIGGGNTAAADALLLSRIAKKVILIHRRDCLRATKIYHKALADAKNVEFCWNSTVDRLLGDESLSGLRIRDIHTDTQTDIACDGIFVSIGRSPATAFLGNQLALDEAGYIIADESTVTNIPGVFAIGDVRTKQVRQVVTAVADGAIACHQAEAYLAQLS